MASASRSALLWAPAFRASESVSYTHLDVYKRQLQADAEKGTVLAVLLDDKLHPGPLKGGADLPDLLGVEGTQQLSAVKGGNHVRRSFLSHP